MPSIIDQLTEIYVFIDDHLKQHPEKAQWRGSNNGGALAFSDTEVLTIGLSESALGVQSLKKRDLSEDSRDNHQAAFPHLPSYKQWLRPSTHVESPGQRPTPRQHCVVERSVKTLLD